MAGARHIVPALFSAVVGSAIVYVIGIRSRSSIVRSAAVRFHHAVGNRIQMRSAGRRGVYTSVLRHRGRTTGRIYETPVWAAPTEDGFAIALVYGSRTDWLRNVLASGAAKIVHDGESCPVDEPEVVPMESARAYFPAALQLVHRLIGVDRCLRVRRIAAPDAPAAPSSESPDTRGARLPVVAAARWARPPRAGRRELPEKEETMKQHGQDEVVPYPKARRFMEEAIRSTHNKPMMHGLLEVDVTKARSYLREMKARTGESPSFTAFIICCLGRAVEEHKDVHALRKGRKQLILFRDVDVLTWIERDIRGQPAVLPCIVRAANRKTFREIHHAIRAAQVQDLATIDVGGAKESQLLPAWLFRPYFELITRIGTWFPREWKKRWGTVTVSALGMIGTGAGWGIPPSSPSICWITVGGIGQKREDVDGEVVVRDYLNLTVSFDHRMIDGAPAARFSERFKELIESGYGLEPAPVGPGSRQSERELQPVG